jgi:murein DD-endopeptidase MepM/ murein hydrolase activator NlpD
MNKKLALCLGICLFVGWSFFLIKNWSTFFLTEGQSNAKRVVSFLEEEKFEVELKEKLNWSINSWAILANGEPILFLATEAEAREVLTSLQTYYFPQDSAQLKIEKSEFQEEIEVLPVQGVTQQISTKEEALKIITQGTEKKAEHTVKKGESLWTIARDHDLTVAELREMNSSLKGTYLQPGDVLNLKKSEPLLTVVSTVILTAEEKVPYKIVYENDGTLWRGQEKVKEAGKTGVSEVTYRVTKCNDLEMGRQIVAKKTLCKSEPQIVRKGAKIMVASRGSGGNGVLSWPLRGQITCPYGKKRGSTIHTGIDIDGNTGDPVFSAGKGKVISAGWKGTYGKCVDIDHGQGLSTRYAHLNKINVSVGQKVSTGSILGEVGSTGRSTGSHLHFEVRVNGRYTNPLRYLN